VAFRVISSNRMPDHATIARYRVRHEPALRGLFVDVLRLCARAGLVRVGVVALDSTRVAGSAALEANVTRAQLEELVAQMLAEAAAVDAAEEADDDLVDPPAVLRGREARRRRLAECQEQLAAEDAAAAAAHAERLARRSAVEAERGQKLRGRKPEPPPPRPGRCNTTDPDSRIMKTQTGFLQGYNAQAMVTPEQIIVAAEATNDTQDVPALVPMLAQVTDNLAAIGVDRPVGAVLADAGYYSNANALAAPTGTELFIATGKDWKRAGGCPHGRIPAGLSPMARMDRKLRTQRGRRLYRLRSQTVEPVFGQIKDARGFRRFFRRGLIAVDSEWQLICTTHNLLKLWRAQTAPAGG
jgi:hypothetical protein